MARQGGGVDVILDGGRIDPKLVPQCKHGPTLLFERFLAGESREPKRSRRFFACSACRDRRHCDFFRWEDDVKVDQPSSMKRLPAPTATMSHEQKSCRLQVFRQLAEEDRRLCESCSLLLLPADWSTHAGHSVREKITFQQLRRPSSLLPPIEDKKSNAQYLFSEETVNFILRSVEKIGFKKVLCVGAPRIHEAISARTKNNKDYALCSLLLDIDERQEQFYPPEQHCRYNMFNHHFFGGSAGRRAYEAFLTAAPPGDVVVLMDPPFGGLVDVLAHTLARITSEWAQLNACEASDLKVMWFFPYFLEPRILAALPAYTMLHYRVEYANHALYKSGSTEEKPAVIASKSGSPVRIFTNIRPDLVILPPKQGYRFCKPCQKYVATDNLHCAECDTCPSKDGRPYVHCSPCGRCVKRSHTHCALCDQCHLEDKPCNTAVSTGCHICGDLSHKRRECPQRKTKPELKRSNTQAQTDGSVRGKKRKNKKAKKQGN